MQSCTISLYELIVPNACISSCTGMDGGSYISSLQFEQFDDISYWIAMSSLFSENNNGIQFTSGAYRAGMSISNSYQRPALRHT